MARRERFPIVRARRWVQVAFLVVVVAIGAQFTHWALALLAGRQPALGRPGGVEGFLPISALMSLRLWLAGDGVHPIHPAGLAILLGVVAMSLVLAKSFCSHVCPVGLLSEWLGRLGQRLLGSNLAVPRWLDWPLRALKFLLLGFFVWATWVVMDLPGTRAFLDSPYNKVADVKMLLFFAEPSRLTIAVLGVLVVGSIFVRDLWCRYLCPYGALVGLLGRFAPLKVTRDQATCTDCAKCTKVCPARLPVHRLVRVASVECTSCQDCVAACPIKDCLAVRPPRWASSRVVRPIRAVALAALVWVAVAGAFRVSGHWRSEIGQDEFARRLQEIDSPLYTHVGGLAASESPTPPELRSSHAPR
ncbi:MAG: 4Fe-4S binding protein [Acidobacteria bacterium]|nr:4Fe-4S binding protein [Acidobacteriota bacterium]